MYWQNPKERRNTGIILGSALALGVCGIGAVWIASGLDESPATPYVFVVENTPQFLNPNIYATEPVSEQIESAPETENILAAPNKEKEPETTEPDICATIGVYPNAYRAWLALGSPKRVEFRNNAGSDANFDPDNPDIRSENGLPTLVHNGDQLCLIE